MKNCTKKIILGMFLLSFYKVANASGMLNLSANYSDRKEYVYPSFGFSVNDKVSSKVFVLGYIGGSFSDNDYPEKTELRYYYTGNAGMGYDFTKKFNMSMTFGVSYDQDHITQGLVKLSANYKLW